MDQFNSEPKCDFSDYLVRKYSEESASIPTLAPPLRVESQKLVQLGTRLSHNKMTANFRKGDLLRPTTRLGTRCGYMFAVYSLVSFKSVESNMGATASTYDDRGNFLKASIQGGGCVAEILYVRQCRDTNRTFFVAKFEKGSCSLTISWNETNETTSITATKSATECGPSTTKVVPITPIPTG